MTTATATGSITKIEEYLGGEARQLLDHTSQGHPQGEPAPARAALGGRDPRGLRPADAGAALARRRSSTTAGSPAPATSRSCRWTRASSTRRAPRFAKNPLYFDPENIVKLAIEGGCNAVASTLGVLGAVARKYAHKIPFLVKINHNEFLTYPNKFDQIFFAQRRAGVRTWAPSRWARPSTSARPSRRARSSRWRRPSRWRTSWGMATVLWCYLRNPALQEGQGLPRLAPTSPARPTTSASRSRPTSSSRSCRRTTAATRRSARKENPLRQDRQAGLHRAHQRPPDRPVPLPGGQLLHGPRRPDQLAAAPRARTTSPRP